MTPRIGQRQLQEAVALQPDVSVALALSGTVSGPRTSRVLARRVLETPTPRWTAYDATF